MGTGKKRKIVPIKTYFKKGWVHVYFRNKLTGEFNFFYKYKPGTGIVVYKDGTVDKD